MRPRAWGPTSRIHTLLAPRRQYRYRAYPLMLEPRPTFARVMSSVRRHAEVVGAGLSGLAAAIALAQRGWQVHVHESAPDLRMFGAGIWLWENGLRVLEALGVLPETLAHTRRVTAWERRDERGRCLLRVEFSDDGRLYIPPRAHL